MDTRKKSNTSSNDVEKANSSQEETNDSSNNSKTLSSNRGSIIACLIYSSCSVSMVLSNKSLASSFAVKSGEPVDIKILIVVFQAIIAVACVEGCRNYAKVFGTSHTRGLFDYAGFEWKIAKQWLPVNLFFCAMLFSGMASLQYNSVPMVTIFKNIANVVTASGDYYFYGNKSVTHKLVITSFSITLLGAVFASWNDISTTLFGLSWMIINCFSTSGYVLYLKHATSHVKLSKFGMVYYNNVLCTMVLLPIAMFYNQVHLFFATPSFHTVEYFFATAFAGTMGFFLNFASLNCVALTGPTTYAVVGSLNKVPVTILGYVFFAADISPETWFFICVSLCGGFLYSYAKIQQSKARGS